MFMNIKTVTAILTAVAAAATAVLEDLNPKK